MREEIVIGTDKPSKFNSICLWCCSDISQNSEFYIIDEKITSIRLYIYKLSEEGNEFEEWISHEKNRDNNLIQKRALELIIPLLTTEEFHEILKREKRISWENGYSKAQYDIRQALGI